MTKKIIEDKKDLEVHLGVYLEDMSLEELNTHITVLIGMYGPKAYLDKEYYGHDGGYNIYVYFNRLETDKEYADRLKKEEKELKKKQAEKSKKEERDKKEYERLKKKFGDSE